MTVFKGYMRIMKKNTGLILLYLGIFFGVTMALQAAAGKETYTSYESEKIKIGVVAVSYTHLTLPTTPYV